MQQRGVLQSICREWNISVPYTIPGHVTSGSQLDSQELGQATRNFVSILHHITRWSFRE